MTTGQQVQTATGAHLVGGLKAPDAESAMRAAGTILGRHLHALTDGETGDRSQWIWWQIGKLTALDGIEMAGTHGIADSENPDYSEFPALTVDESVTELPPRSLGYAEAAQASYPIFRRLREEGVVPDGVRFQVSIPTPYATVIAWVADDAQERFFNVYADAMAREVEEIAGAIDADDLTIQWDVAVEIGALTGNFPAAGRLGEKQGVIDSLRDVLQRTPAGPERGVHLCYGDYKHRHFAIPEDLGLCVELANAVGDLSDFVHMPADRETGRNPGYFEPLRDLRDPGRLALGVIDYEGDAERTSELVAAATEGGGGTPFAVATECGMARIDERRADAPSLEQLLELHAANAAPIR
jgi:methionine synthase II (cobalamin-independent)